MFGSSDASVSSKRVVGFLCFLLLAEIVQAVIWFNKPTPSELMYVLSTILLTCFGMNTAISMKSMGTKSDVASDLIKEQPEPDTAKDVKDVLNSNKP